MIVGAVVVVTATVIGAVKTIRHLKG